MTNSHAPGAYHRRSVRLRDYDYGQEGAYFVTLCAHDRACLFGDVVDDGVHLTDYGQIANEEWAYTELLRSHVRLDAYVVMPNHVHGIVVVTHWLRAPSDTHSRAATSDAEQRAVAVSQTLGAIVRGFKGAVTYRVNVLRGTPRIPVWQRNYYERVIRNDRELERIRTYIACNPARWAEDENNPARMPPYGH